MDNKKAINILEKRLKKKREVIEFWQLNSAYDSTLQYLREEIEAYEMALDSLKGIRPKTEKLDDKKEICKALVPVLQMTRNLYDLVDLEYRVEEGMELVIATFDSGIIKTVNVNLDSGTTMIRDIIYQIV